MAEEALDGIQNAINWPADRLHAVKYYINNRWITRTHALTAHPRDIKPGQWRDVGTRFLPCLFNELVDYVEMELAWWHLAWSPEERPKYNMPWWAVGWWRVRTWRCPQAGLDNLKWQASLKMDDEWVKTDDPDYGKPTTQALNAMEILALYNWWKNVYPVRPDPHDAGGWTAYMEHMRVKYAEEDGEDGMPMFRSGDEYDRAMSRAALDRTSEMEAVYEAEDTEMLIRLIKIRHALWT
jgi:hypothetical protein